MLRITRQASGERTILNLEGRLSGRFVAELLSTCESIESNSPLILDLRGLIWIDQRGIDAIRDLIRRQVHIEGCSAFVGQLLKEHTS